MTRFAAIIILLLTAIAAADDAPFAVTPPTRSTPVDFEREILPLLKSNCLACHNRTKPKAGLVLETPADIRKGGDSGPAALPGKSADSLLLKLAAHRDRPAMPPKDNKVQAVNLTPAQLGLLALWIDQGAAGEVRAGQSIDWRPLPKNLTPIYSVALSADGRLAVCGSGNALLVYDLPSRRLVARIPDAHRDLIQSLALSEDGTLLATGGYREVKLWRRPRFAEVLSLEAPAPITATASFDGRRLALVGADGVIRFYDPSTARPLAEFKGHSSAVRAVRFSADGRRMASASDDNELLIWDAMTAQPLRRIDTPAAIHAVAWAGLQLVDAGADGVIRLRDSDAAVAHELRGHQGAVHSLDTAPGVLLSGGEDGVLRVWDIAKKQIIREIKHGGPIAAAAIRPDATRFASAGTDGVLKLWDAEGKLLAERSGAHDARLRHAAAQRAAAVAAMDVAYRKGVVNDLATQQKAAADRLKKAQDAAAAAARALSEKLAATTAAADALTKAEQEKKPEDALKPLRTARDAATAASAKAMLVKATADDELALAVKAQAQLDTSLAAASAAVPRAESRQQQLRSDEQRAATSVADSKRPSRCLAFAPDGATLAASDDQGVVHAFAAETGTALETIHAGTAQAAVTFLDSSRLIVAAPDRSARVYDLDPRWKLDQVLGAPGADAELSDRVTALAFSRDARLLAAGGGVPSRSGQVLVWRVESTRTTLARRLEDLHSDTVLALDFSADSLLLASASADRFARVTDLSTGKIIANFEGHTHHVQSVAWKPDGRTLATAGADNLVKLWDLPTASRRRNIAGFSREVTSIRFVAGTDQLLSASADGRLRLLTEAGADARALPYPAANDFLYAAALSADGSTAIAAGAQGALRAWNLTTGALIAEFNTAP